MLKRANFVVLTTLLLALSPSVPAQNAQSVIKPQSREVIASASGASVRFSVLGEMLQLRLEVVGSSGETLFDSDFKAGNVIDWSGIDTTGQVLTDGSYLCVVSIKDWSGQITRKQAIASLQNQSVGLRRSDSALLTAAQAQRAGENGEDVSVMIVEPGQQSETAVIAHDGATALLVSGGGGLSISSGDFFANKIIEHVRLTAEGNVGIGVPNPQARLDVAGLIRASEGIVFPDGSIQYSASRKTFGPESLRPGGSEAKRGHGKDFGPAAIDISGTGTTGKIPKWSDGPNGVLNDSNITEASGAIGINGAPSTSFRLDVNGNTRIRGSNPGFNLEGLRTAGNLWAFQTVDDDGRFRLFGQDNVNPGVERLTISLSNGNVGLGATTPVRHLHVFGASDQEIGIQSSDAGGRQWTLQSARGAVGGRFEIIDRTAGSSRFAILSDGSVGIGTTAPGARLDVSGAINTSTQYNILGQRVFTATNSSTTVGWLAGGTGTANTFFGSQAGRNTGSGTENSFFGDQAGLSNTTGSTNSFFGAGAGDGNSSGLANAFFGRLAGNANATGNFNTIIGALADVGSSNLTNAAAIGARARVDQSNSLVLGGITGVNSGTSVRVGIGTTTPANTFHVEGPGTATGAWGGFTEVVSRFKQTTAGSHSAISVDALAGQDSVVYLSGNGSAKWSVRNDASNSDKFQIRSHISGTNDARLTIQANGNVGIGTTSPDDRFAVTGNSDAGHVAVIHNTSSSTNADVLKLIVTPTTFPTETNNYITFADLDAGNIGAIQGNSHGGIALISGSGDYAEFLPRLNPVEQIRAGDIVGLYGGQITRQTRGASKVMAVSSNPIVVGNDPGKDARGGYERVAFIGQVQVSVRGPVQAGDFIVASGMNDGVGVAVAPECISSEQFALAVGQAWETSADQGVKPVRVAVGLIQRDPTVPRILESGRRQATQIAALEARLAAIELKVKTQPFAARRTASRSGRGAMDLKR